MKSCSKTAATAALAVGALAYMGCVGRITSGSPDSGGDGGAPTSDSGAPGLDGGSSGTDSGSIGNDAGFSGQDGGQAIDAGPACSNPGPPLNEGGSTGIASKYRGDVGIENDPAVLWVENFNEDGGIAAASSRWDSVDSVSLAAMSLSSNVPPGSPFTHSADWNYASASSLAGSSVNFLKCLNGVAGQDPRYSCESSAGGSGCCDCGTFCNPLPSTVGAVYFRYYIYVTPGSDPIWHFFEMGAGAWCGCAGSQPDGTNTFHTNTDVNLDAWKWDFYTYWVDEHPSGSGSGTTCPNNCCDTANCYWYGNGFMGGYASCADLRPAVTQGQWLSVELMIKNNTFSGTTANYDGEQAMWINGSPVVSSSSTGQCSQVVSHPGPGFPLGSWDRATFCPDNAQGPFSTDNTVGHGFRWRTTPTINVSWIRPEVYEQNAQTAPALDHLLVAHVVVATKYIGPLQP